MGKNPERRNYFSVISLDDFLLSVGQVENPIQNLIFSSNDLGAAVRTARQQSISEISEIYLILRYETPKSSDIFTGEEPDISHLAQIGYDKRVLLSNTARKMLKAQIRKDRLFCNTRISEYDVLNRDLTGKIEEMERITRAYSKNVLYAATIVDDSDCYHHVLKLREGLISSLKQVHETSGLTISELSTLGLMSMALNMPKEQIVRDTRKEASRMMSGSYK
jgi:hypothetical protein